jgi:hypothetical protein
MKVKFIVTVDDDETDVEYAKKVMNRVGKVEVVDFWKSVLVVGGGEMLALSCSLAGMCAEINDSPAQLEECVEVFREVYSKGIVTELQLKMVEECKNQLSELIAGRRKMF